MGTEPTGKRNEQPGQRRHAAKALVEQDGAVLLVQERHRDGTPFWTLPGGGIDEDESPTESLHRELDEELHCNVSISRRIGQFMYAHQSSSRISLYNTYECTVHGQIRPNPAEGVFAFTWACPPQLPDRVLPAVESFIQSEIFDPQHSESAQAAGTTTTHVADD